MAVIRKIYHNLLWLIKGVRVFGLAGKAGTGKSFRAQLVAQKYHIDLIIDDGILIKNQHILAGKSAKQAAGIYSAIKTALFHNAEHRYEVKKALWNQKFKRILILGTSNRMIKKIAQRLNLPPPQRIIQIEEIASEDEIELAKDSRNNDGKHIIPVPAVEVKRKHSRIFFNSVKIFFKKRFGLINKHHIFEKSIVQPIYSKHGSVSISEEAMTQMIMHCVDEFDASFRVKKIKIRETGIQYIIELSISVPYGRQVSGLMYELQAYVMNSLEQYAGIIIKNIDIIIDHFS